MINISFETVNLSCLKKSLEEVTISTASGNKTKKFYLLILISEISFIIMN